MHHYMPQAYQDMHEKIRVITLDLKLDSGQDRLHRELEHCDILLTSFRPSALKRIGLDWNRLHRRHPALNLITIVGAPGAAAEIAGHDLTYMSEQGLVQGTALPPTLFADMGGALLAVEAVYQSLREREASGRGTFREVALTDAASWLARPLHWGLTRPQGAVGGAHAGYQVYACRDGRAAVAALEPHFAKALAEVAGLRDANLLKPQAHRSLKTWFASKTRKELDELATRHDLPVHTMV